MKNLKKTLAVVLAFAMVLSMGFSAFAYTDVTAGTKVAEAVGILSNLGIFTGFEDGTFKPNDTVTRAQMAAIICRTLGYEDQAAASTGSTIFNDVPASHWASGYINVAQSLQIVNGYGDGNFGPEDQVTYEQAIKMIVVALGYELDAQAKGGWSTGYLAVAAREGISKNSNGVVGAPAARGTIAVLVYNALEVPLMDQSIWTPSGDDDAYAKLQETVLSRYLDVTKIEAVVNNVPYATFATAGYKEDADEMVEFDLTDAKAYGFEGTSKVYKAINYPADLSDTFDASLVPEINNMAGRKVVAYVGINEDTNEPTVFAVAEKQGANKVTVLSATQLTSSTKSGVIEYKEAGSSSKKTLDLEKNEDDEYDIIPVINFGTGNSDDDEAVINTVTLAEYVENGGIITLISNDANSKIDKIFITVYSGEAVIEEVNEEDGVISFESYTDDLDDIDTEDEDVLYVVVKDGAVATVADIAANDTVSIVGDSLHETFNLYYVSSKTVTGRVDSYGDDTVDIGGEEYELSPLADYVAPTDSDPITAALSGKEGIFFLNVDGQIAHDEATTNKNFGIVIAAGNDGRKNLVEIVFADGTSAEYELHTKAKLGEAATDTAVLGALQDILDNEPAGTWEYAEVENIPELVFDITVKNGKVTKLVATNVAEGAENVSGSEYDAENMEYGNLSFNDATVVVSVGDVDEGAKVEADDIKVGKVADFFVDDEGTDFHLWAYDYDNSGVAGLVIGTGLTAAVSKESAAFIVTGYKTKDIDDEIAYVINGFQDGKKVSYTILDEDLGEGESVEDFTEGNILLLGVANAEGIITDYDVLATAEGLVITDGECKEDEYYFFGALATSEGSEPTASKFYLDEPTVIGDAPDGIDGTIVSMRNAARYTLVDFSEDVEEPTVSKKSKGTSLFTRAGDKYDYEVFVRYFDKTQVEVIVYKYLAE